MGPLCLYGAVLRAMREDSARKPGILEKGLLVATLLSTHTDVEHQPGAIIHSSPNTFPPR